ncbi:MAG: class I SAM-dependent methyltransferase, partial [Dehalococcoidales bacterium]
MACRVCGGNEDIGIGCIRPYFDYECTVYECLTCGCRFVNNDASIYERLHASKDSTYNVHEVYALTCLEYFKKGETEGLRNYLGRERKNAFIISAIENNAGMNKLLEIGCSKGYLTGYFLIKGYNVLGVDLSPSAIRFARDSFGDHFAMPDSERVQLGKPYDA